MVEVERTLVKSPPELWEVVDDLELMGRLGAELFGSHAIEVVDREPGKRLAWQVSGRPEARAELALAERAWGTQVAIRVEKRGDRGEEFAGAVLERLLDELGFAQRRPSVAREWMSGSGEAAADARTGAGASSRIEETVEDAPRSATDPNAASAERRLVGGLEEKIAGLARRLGECHAGAEAYYIESVNARREAKEAYEKAGEAHRRAEELYRQATRAIERATERLSRSELRLARADAAVNDRLAHGGRSLDELSDLITRQAAGHAKSSVEAAQDRLAKARKRLRLETEAAHRRERERIEETERGLPGSERQRELTLARRERDSTIRAADQRLAKQAAEIFAHLEREAGRLQERARRVAVGAARKEVDRRVGRSLAAALCDIEDRLIATVRRGAGEAVARRAGTTRAPRGTAQQSGAQSPRSGMRRALPSSPSWGGGADHQRRQSKP
jgi:hypothetical protein